MVPSGWELRELKELTTIYDGTHATPKYVESGVPFYSVEHLTKGDFSKTKFITEEVFDRENKRIKLERHDILMTRIGDIGTAVHLDWDVRASFYVSLALLKATSNFDSSFMTQYINSSEFHRELWKRIIHVAFPKKINLGEIGKCHVCLPPLPEQRKIAKILSTWDKAIRTTERLIDNSKQQKKALMQQLLTGAHTQRRRLLDDSGKPFDGEWEELYVKEFGQVITGNTPSKSDESNYGTDISWATAEDFKSKYVSDTKIKLSLSGAKLARLVPKGSVLVTCIASIGKNAIANEELATNQQINAVKVNKSHSNEFFYYLIEHNKHKLIAWAGTTAVPILNKSSFEKIKLKAPNLVEQKRIAAVLASADKEITLLEQQLADLKQEKKALMQQLLTGKRRVKVDDKEVV